MSEYIAFSFGSCATGAGIGIVITGILGIFASKSPYNRCLLGTALAFNILAVIGSGVDTIIFILDIM